MMESIKKLREMTGFGLNDCKKALQECNGDVGISGHASEAFDLEAECIFNNDKTIEDLYNEVDYVIGKRLRGIGNE